MIIEHSKIEWTYESTDEFFKLAQITVLLHVRLSENFT